MSHPISRHPAYLNAIDASVWERAAIAKMHPELEEYIADAATPRSKIHPPASWGLVIETHRLKGLLGLHWDEQHIDSSDVADAALVLVLPSAFRWVAREMAMQTPENLNSTELDQRSNSSRLAWEARLPGDTCATIVAVPDDDMLGWTVSDVYRLGSHQWGWMPVIIVAGDTVAVGGFVVDEVVVCGMQAAHGSAESYRAEAVYSDEELATAERQSALYGLRPWLYDRWPTEYGWMLEPEMVDYYEV